MQKLSNQNSNFHYTRGIAPKRVTSGGAHLCGLAPEQSSSEKTSQRWRTVGDALSDFTESVIELQPYTDGMCFTTELNINVLLHSIIKVLKPMRLAKLRIT